jgi:hypothetical protein
MKFRRFFEILVLVAVVAAIYAPPIQLALNSQIHATSTVSPLNTGWGGTSLFAADLREMGYRVVYANSTSDDLQAISGRVLYVLMGPDFPLTEQEETLIGTRMQDGELTLLMAQGNQSNNHLLTTLFGIAITGEPITDPNSPFQDKRIINATVVLDGAHLVQLNVASPIVPRERSSQGFVVEPIGYTGRQSYDAGNPRPGFRIIAIAISRNNTLSGVLISDSGVFINAALNSTKTTDAQLLAAKTIEQLTQGDRGTTVLIDDAHYDKIGTQIPFSIPPVGMLVAVFAISYLESFNQTYDAFLASAPFPLLLVIGLSALAGTYWGLGRWMGRQPTGVDTAEIPVVESDRLVDSVSKAEITRLKKSGRFYLDTLMRLYYVLDELVKREFGVPLEEIGEETAKRRIADRIDSENYELLFRISRDLGKIREKAEGRRRFLFPPVLRWSQKFSQMITDTDKVLKAMGTYLVESEGRVKGIEYRLRKR